MKKQIVINDVAPRDGLQNQDVHLDPQQRLELIQSLVDSGVRAIEAVSFVHPKAVPAMAGAAEVVAGLPLMDEVDYSALVPNLKGYELAVASGIRSVAVVLCTTETMNQKNINMSLEQTIASCEAIIRQANQDGVNARAYVSVAFECPFEGDVGDDIVIDLTDRMFATGADEVIVADSIGAANPAEVDRLFKQMSERFEPGRLSAHFHDTRAMALANVWAAMQHGIAKFDSSVAGLGGCPFAPGAAGNLATEDVVNMVHQMGLETGISEASLMDTVKLASRLMNRELGGRMTPWLKRQAQRAA